MSSENSQEYSAQTIRGMTSLETLRARTGQLELDLPDEVLRGIHKNLELLAEHYKQVIKVRAVK